MIGFADDIAIVVAYKTEETLIEDANIALQTISSCMEGSIETAMLNGKTKIRPVAFTVEGI